MDTPIVGLNMPLHVDVFHENVNVKRNQCFRIKNFLEKTLQFETFQFSWKKNSN